MFGKERESWSSWSRNFLCLPVISPYTVGKVLCFNLKIRFRLDTINTVNFATRRENCAISSGFYLTASALR